MNIKGTGASNGVAVGKTLLLLEEEIKISDTKINFEDINQEIEKVDNAILNVKNNLNTLIEETKIKLGEKHAGIFEAHLSILEDPELYSQIKLLIENDKYNALKAVDSAANTFHEVFSTIQDEYFRERAADLLDVKNKILKSILGIKEISLSNISEETIIVAHDLTPSQTSQLNPKFVKGFLCNIGGRTSHSAIMARSIGIPAVVGLKDITKKIKNNEFVGLNGNNGEVEINLNDKQIEEWKVKENNWIKLKKELESYKGKETITKDGYKFTLEANIGSFKDVEKAIENDAKGIGLFRTEFLYMENNNFPSEEQQFAEYKKVLENVNHQVIIRTLDIGGDKELTYWDLPKEMNPFLGYRAIRLCLDQTEIFKTQIRALLRASVYGKLGIMFPMIATVEEFKAAKKIVLECKEELIKENKKVSDDFELGIMIEIPAAAVNSSTLAKHVDFFSIGTNDLIQYSLAVDRISEKVSYLYQPFHPAVLKLIKMTIDGAKSGKRKIPVGMCGEMAGDPIAAPLLVGMGLDNFSMSASEILNIRKIINNLNKKEMEELVEQAFECETNDEVKKLVLKTIKL